MPLSPFASQEHYSLYYSISLPTAEFLPKPHHEVVAGLGKTCELCSFERVLWPEDHEREKSGEE